jgi:hypothetical protein
MTELYLLPENVNAEHTAQVLEFLNAATSAAEIAAAVELPDELDVGLRVAARILARREQLGGFTTLEQVYAVPYVGPERFTEIVTNLSGARPPQRFDEQIDRALLSQLTQRLNTLEAQLKGSATIRLTALNPDVWLGQDIVLLAAVADARGKPLIETAVTFVTTWGRLQGRAGLRSVTGNSVTLKTDHLGMCKLRLTAAIGESLTEAAQAALSSALTVLGAGSVGPRNSLSELSEIARRYRAPGGERLRGAVDAYFKRYGRPDDAEAPIDSLAGWPLVPITVLAYLPPAINEASARPPTTLLNARARNWFYAWTWAYRRVLDEESTLLASLDGVSGDERDSSRILSDLLGRVGTFVQREGGFVGQMVGQGFAEAKLNDFVQTGLAKFPATSRTALLSGVTTGAKSLSGGRQLFAALEGSRSGLTTKIASGLESAGSGVLVDRLETRIADLERVAVTEQDLAAFERNVLAQAAANTVTQLSQFQGRVDQSLAGKADTNQFETLNRQVLDLQNQNRTFNSDLTRVTTRLNGVDTNISALDARVRRGPS